MDKNRTFKPWAAPRVPWRVCFDCYPNSVYQARELLYTRLKTRNRHHFGKDVDFTKEQFWEWLKGTDFDKLYAEHLKIKKKVGNRQAPCVDRITSWLEYRFDNMQVVSHSENASKGATVALGSRVKTMKFFERIRKDKGLTKYEMANYLGMLPQTYYYYEEKARGCSFEILCLIKRKLKLSWSTLGKYIEDEFGDIEIVEKPAKGKK